MQHIQRLPGTAMQRLCAPTSSLPFHIQIGTLVMVLMLAVRVNMRLRSRHETLAGQRRTTRSRGGVVDGDAYGPR